MKRALLAASGLVLACALSTVTAQAQTCTLRGKVLDQAGQGLPGVKVEMEFKGESRVKVVKTFETDRKGAYVRAGLASGRWRLRFTKDGYDTVETDTDVSGGISDLAPVAMRPRAPAAPVAGLDAGAEAAGASAPELRTQYTQALAALKAGRDAEAETLLKLVLEKAPDVGQAHFWLGELYLGRQDLASAEASLRKAVELLPEDTQARVALATTLGAAGRNDDALALLQGGAEHFDQDADYQFTLGVTAMNAGHEDEARAAFEKTLALDANRAEPHYYLGTLAISRNDVAGARSHLETYVGAAPEGSPNAPVAKKLLESLKTRK